MIFEVHLDAPLHWKQVNTLAQQASANCFVENTLAKAIP